MLTQVVTGISEMDFILLHEPVINGNEWNYVKECLDTGWVSSAGKYVDLFEEKICEYTGAKHAVACVNGTSALHISLLLAGVESGDEVLVPTLTFIAPINTVRYLNAYPVFMDCEKSFFNVDVDKVIQFCEEECEFDGKFLINKKTNRKVKAVIPVHVFGNPCEMNKLIELSAKYNLKIIEDATESLGSKYKEKFTGTLGDLGCYSFNGNKIITTGGGGMIVTNNSEYAEKAKYLSTQAKNDPVYYVHDGIGYNYRMSNVTAAIGCAQLEKIDEFINIKRKNAETYKQLLRDVEGIEFVTNEPKNCSSNFWFYTILVNEKKYGLSRDELIKKLNNSKIQARPVWKLNHQQKPFTEFQSYKIENAISVAETAVNVPSSVSLIESEIEYISKIIKQNENNTTYKNESFL
jgi:perosamine synthetase